MDIAIRTHQGDDQCGGSRAQPRGAPGRAVGDPSQGPCASRKTPVTVSLQRIKRGAGCNMLPREN